MESRGRLNWALPLMFCGIPGQSHVPPSSPPRRFLSSVNRKGRWGKEDTESVLPILVFIHELSIDRDIGSTSPVGRSGEIDTPRVAAVAPGFLWAFSLPGGGGGGPMPVPRPQNGLALACQKACQLSIISSH